MNMLKNEENDKYRATIKNTLEFDPEILKRFVNFMNNPDEDTAVAQFGKGDKYFGICTLLVTMPGLPMFGHGQIEGFEEKYGMEYRRSYKDEKPDGYLVDRHDREIFPLMKRRSLFSGSANFRIYDLYSNDSVNENVFAYSNRVWINGRDEKTLVFFNNSYYETSGWIKVSDPAIPVEGGGTCRDSLSEALAIHGENQFFTLLREQISGLWFIRSSKAISEDGFFVGLRGYETQVFLDICEVEDDVKGRWARLNNDLNGRGVPDPLAAIKDIYLGELYYRFTELLKPEIIVTMNETLDKSAAGFDSFVKSLEKPVREFIKTASHFITGANGAYDEWQAPKDRTGVTCKFTAVSENAIWKEYEAFLARLKEFRSVIKKSKSPLLVRIADCLSKGQLLYSIALGYGVLSLLPSIIGKEASGKNAANLAFDHWDFGRKLREIYKSFGATDQETWRINDITRGVLNRAGNIAKIKWTGNASEFAALIIEENYIDEDFRRILGINFYDDIAWFNKEGFEAALFYSSLFFMVEGSVDISAEERIERIVSIYEALTKAEAKSEYRFDYLLDILTAKPKPKSKAKADTKASTKPAAKTSAKTSAKPAAKTSAKASAKPAAKTSAKASAKPAAKTSAKTSAKPAVKTGAKASAKPAVKKSAKSSAKKPAAKATAKTSKKPAAKTTAKPKPKKK